MVSVQPGEIVLVRFTADELVTVEPWFLDPDTRRWVGDRSWPAMVLHLASDPPAAHRGQPVVRRESFLAMANSVPVALADVETYADGTASFAFVVAPGRRGQGVCRRVALALLALVGQHAVHELFAGVELGNLASNRSLAAAGFEPRSLDPDSEGFVYYTRKV